MEDLTLFSYNGWVLKKTPPIFLILIISLVAATITSLVQPTIFHKLANREKSNISLNQPIKNALAVQTASPSATPKTASPSAVIHQNWGRSVNVPILTYHYIGLNPKPSDRMRDNLSVHPDVFDDQLSVLKAHGYNPITLDTLYAALKGTTTLPAKPIVLTFDDGYVDFYHNAFPILRKYGFHAVSFIPTGLMDQGYYLHWDQIKEMDSSGLISFQAHSIHHPNLMSLSSAQVDHELTKSKQVLESKLGKTVNFMAYPYGAANEFTWNAAKKAGYLGAVGTWYGTFESEGTLYDLPRVKIAGVWTKEIFAQKFP